MCEKWKLTNCRKGKEIRGSSRRRMGLYILNIYIKFIFKDNHRKVIKKLKVVRLMFSP